MALDVGELIARLKVDNKGMDKGLKEGESKLHDFSDKLTKLAAAGGLAVALAFGAAILNNISEDNVGAKISAQLGGTASDAAVYGKTAGKLYAENWGESIQDIGDTVKAVAGAHLVPPGATAELEDVTRQAQILKDVMGVDVTESVNAVSQMIKTGLVPNAKEGFDLIAAGMQGGVDKAGDLTDTLNEYSVQFHKLGIDGYQAMGLLQQGLQGGARDSDLVADALKEFSIRAIDGSTTTAAGFKALGLNAQQMTNQMAAGGNSAAAGLNTVLTKLEAMKDPAAQAAAATALFGTQSEDLGQALFKLNLGQAEAAFDGTTGAIERAGKAVSETDTAKLEGLKREAMGAAQAFAAGLVPSLESAGKFLKENRSWVEPLALSLGGLAAVIVGVNLATKAWAAAETAFTAVKEVATVAQWLWNAALLASPITWIVLGILLLVGVIVLIATKTTWFQTIWKYVWSGIKAAASAVWGWFSGTFWPGLKAVLEGIASVAMWLWHNGIEPAMVGIGEIFAFVYRIVMSFANLFDYFMRKVVGGAATWLYQNAILPAAHGIADLFIWLYQNILTPIGQGIMTVLGWIGTAATWLYQSAILPAAHGIADLFIWLWHSVIEPAGAGIASAAMWVWTNGIKPAYDFIKSGTKSVGDFIAGVFSKVGGWIGDAFSGAVGIVKGALNGIIGAINSAIGAINGVIESANKIPGVDFPTIPKIPRLAGGGVVSPRPGGTPVVMGDGGQVEYGVPEDRLLGMLGKAFGMGAGGGASEQKIVLELVGDGVLRIVRNEVKAKGGNVQKVLAGTS